MKRRLIVVLTFGIDEPEEIVKILKAIDPPHLPHFAGEVRVALDPYASHVIDYLEGRTP